MRVKIKCAKNRLIYTQVQYISTNQTSAEKHNMGHVTDTEQVVGMALGLLFKR